MFLVCSSGIHYYHDANWIAKVPKGVLDVRNDEVQAVLRRGPRRSSLSEHLSIERSSSEPSSSSSKKSVTENLKTFERTSSDPMVTADFLENKLLGQCHVEKGYQTTTENFTFTDEDDEKKPSKKGSPVKKSKKNKYVIGDHSSFEKSGSSNSRTDSGFESEQWAKKKGLTPNSGTWTSKPKDIAGLMQPEDTLATKTDSSVKSTPVTPTKSRRRDRKRRERKKREAKSKSGIWSRGKQWARRYVLDKHIDDDTISSAGAGSESEFESSSNSRYQPLPEYSSKRQEQSADKPIGGEPKTWEDIDLETPYIDPRTIVSVPEMTPRLQHLQEHKNDGLETEYAKVPASNVETTAFVHKNDAVSEEKKMETPATPAAKSPKLARGQAIRRTVDSDQQETKFNHSNNDEEKISNLETENAASADDNEVYEDVSTQMQADDEADNDDNDCDLDEDVPNKPASTPSPKPEPKVIPIAKVEPKVVPATKPESRVIPMTKSESRVIPLTKSEPRVIPVTKPEPKSPVVKPEPRIVPYVKPEPKAEDTKDHAVKKHTLAGNVIGLDSSPRKNFSSYRKAYLDRVGAPPSLALSPTTTPGVQSLPYDVLSEMYLNEEIAAEKAAEEEKRRLRAQALEEEEEKRRLALERQEKAQRGEDDSEEDLGEEVQREDEENAKVSSLPNTGSLTPNDDTYVSLLNYAAEEETRCKVCRKVHHPHCGDDPNAPRPPPRPDLNEPDNELLKGRNKGESARSQQNVDASALRSAKAGLRSTTPNTSAEVYAPSSDVYNDVDSQPLYMNLDDVVPATRSSPVFNPPPLPPRQPSLKRPDRNGEAKVKGSPLKGSKKFHDLDSDASLQESKQRVKSVSPMMQRKIQQFNDKKEKSALQGTIEQFDKESKDKPLNRSGVIQGKIEQFGQARNSRFSDSRKPPSSQESRKPESSKPAKQTVDITIQPATPVHKPSKLQTSDNNGEDVVGDLPNGTVDGLEEADDGGSLQRVGSVADRRKLFERPLVRGYQRASHREYTPQPQINKGPERASMRSVDFPTNKKQPGPELSVFTPVENSGGEEEFLTKPEGKQKEDNTSDGIVLDVRQLEKPSSVIQDSIPVSKRLVAFEKPSENEEPKRRNGEVVSKSVIPASSVKQVPNFTKPNPSESVSESKTVLETRAAPTKPGEVPTQNTSSPTPDNKGRKTEVAKENKYEAGWKLHPDKLKIPDVFK